MLDLSKAYTPKQIEILRACSVVINYSCNTSG